MNEGVIAIQADLSNKLLFKMRKYLVIYLILRPKPADFDTPIHPPETEPYTPAETFPSTSQNNVRRISYCIPTGFDSTSDSR